jgi:RNA polymerase sigma-70 factor (family 1)
VYFLIFSRCIIPKRINLQEPLPYNEPELLRQVAAGSTPAFQRLVLAYQRKLFSYIYKVTASRELTRDMVQDIFLNLWLMRAKLPEINNLNAYLHRVAHNEIYHSLQKVAREELVLHHLKNEGQVAEDAGQPLLSKEIRLYIQQLVDQLTPRQREVFLLSREEGLSYEEIARHMGIGFETVKYHMAEALKFLRAGLGSQYGSQAVILFVIWQLGNV